MVLKDKKGKQICCWCQLEEEKKYSIVLEVVFDKQIWFLEEHISKWNIMTKWLKIQVGNWNWILKTRHESPESS